MKIESFPQQPDARGFASPFMCSEITAHYIVGSTLQQITDLWFDTNQMAVCLLCFLLIAATG